MKKLYLFITALLLACQLPAEEESTIPVLDMREYYNEETRDEFIQKLQSALNEYGFFAVHNTGANLEKINYAYQKAEEFFRLPISTKVKYCDPKSCGQRGYVQSEAAKGKPEKDHKEFLHIGREDFTGMSWRNIWPEEVDLRNTVYPVYEELENYLVFLQEAIARALDLDPDHFLPVTHNSDSLLRVIHYPPMENVTNVLWAEAHTDIDFLTILPKATNDGLEVLHKDGHWIRVKVPEDSFIINAGDMLENLSNGYFRSSVHRVRSNNPEKERFSMVFFIHGHKDANFSPLSHMIEKTGGIKKYANATEFELLMERLADLGLASPEMLRELSESNLMERLIEVNRASPDAMVELRKHNLASEKVLKEMKKQGI